MKNNYAYATLAALVLIALEAAAANANPPAPPVSPARASQIQACARQYSGSTQTTQQTTGGKNLTSTENGPGAKTQNYDAGITHDVCIHQPSGAGRAE